MDVKERDVEDQWWSTLEVKQEEMKHDDTEYGWWEGFEKVKEENIEPEEIKQEYITDDDWWP